jgi:hypothetical protein
MAQKFPLWQLMTGYQFNELAKGLRFYKLTSANELHRGFLYRVGRNPTRNELRSSRDGLNVDTEWFIPLPYNPGLHFTEESLVPFWVDVFKCHGTPIKYKRKVTIANDAKVYCQLDRFKADQLILGPREEL